MIAGVNLLVAPNFGIHLPHPTRWNYSDWLQRWEVVPNQCRILSDGNQDKLVLTASIDDILYSCGGGECIYLDLWWWWWGYDEPMWEKVYFPEGDLKEDIFRGSVVYEKKLWVVNNNDDELTSDFLDVMNWIVVKGPSYPEGRHDGCNIQINETFALVTGGHATSPSTLFINLETEEWTVGPDLSVNRYKHSCETVVTTGGNTLAIGNVLL